MIARLRSVAHAGKTKCKRSLWTIPYFFTFANALLGVLSVIKAIDADFTAAAYCILLAAFMDGCDGRLARAFGSTSDVGSELDSLCDAISFCVSPAILVYSWGLHEFGLAGIAVVGLYVCAGLLRLAKFTAGADEQSTFFLGLPTTVAGFLLASVVLYHDWIMVSRWHFILDKPWLLLLLTAIALLMVSTIQFPTIKKHRIRSVAMFKLFVFVMIVFVMSYFLRFPFLFSLLVFYICGSLIGWGYCWAKQLIASKF